MNLLSTVPTLMCSKMGSILKCIQRQIEQVLGLFKSGCNWEVCGLIQRTEVRFASFLSGGFITAIVVNQPEKKLAKRTSVQWCTVRGHWMAPQSRHSKLYNLTPEADGHRCTPLHNLDATQDWKLRLDIWWSVKNYRIVASRSTSWKVTTLVTNWIWTQIVTWAPKNKSCPNELKFCEDSRNPKSIRC